MGGKEKEVGDRGQGSVIFLVFIGGFGGFLGFIVLFFLVKFCCKNESIGQEGNKYVE